MSKLRIGIAGRRGAAFYAGLRVNPAVELVALCDLDREWLATESAAHGIPQTFDSFTAMLDVVDAVVIATPMQLHAPQAMLALAAGKHVMSEVTACVSLEECWRLVEAVEASGRVYMLSENYCYNEENILIREMVRKGIFGEIYFGEGEYVHDVRFLHHDANGQPTWRYYWQVGAPGNTYITHELGPVMQWFNAQNPGDRIATVTCLGTGVHTDPEHPHDDTSLTLVKLTSGKLLKMRIDMMSNTPGMTFYSLQGVNGTYESGRGGGVAGRIWTGPNQSVGWTDPKREWRPVSDYVEHMPADWRPHVERAKQSGHGGGDFHTGRLFVQSILDGSPPDVDIYQAMEWTAAGLCSQLSIAQGGLPIRVPDFRNRAERPLWLRAPEVRP